MPTYHFFKRKKMVKKKVKWLKMAVILIFFGLSIPWGLGQKNLVADRLWECASFTSNHPIEKPWNNPSI